MLDEKRIRQMTKLAFFEKKEEKNALRIGRYFRSDYIGKELLKNFFPLVGGSKQAVYSIAVYVISTIRYQGAQKKLKWYGKELDDLQNMYEEQEKSGKKSGRRRKET